MVWGSGKGSWSLPSRVEHKLSAQGRLAGNGSWPPWKRLEFRILDRTLKLSLNPQFFLHLTTNTLKGLELESSIDKELFIWYDGHWSHSPCSHDSTVARNGQYIQIWWRACFSSSYQRRGPQGTFTELGIRDAHGQLPYSGSVGSEATPVSVRKSSSRTWNAQQVRLTCSEAAFLIASTCGLGHCFP